MKTYFYICIHLPTQQKFTRHRRFATLEEYYQLLCRWNTQQPDTWAYAPTGDTA